MTTVNLSYRNCSNIIPDPHVSTSKSIFRKLTTTIVISCLIGLLVSFSYIVLVVINNESLVIKPMRFKTDTDSKNIMINKYNPIFKENKIRSNLMKIIDKCTVKDFVATVSEHDIAGNTKKKRASTNYHDKLERANTDSKMNYQGISQLFDIYKAFRYILDISHEEIRYEANNHFPNYYSLQDDNNLTYISTLDKYDGNQYSANNFSKLSETKSDKVKEISLRNDTSHKLHVVRANSSEDEMQSKNRQQVPRPKNTSFKKGTRNANIFKGYLNEDISSANNLKNNMLLTSRVYFSKNETASMKGNANTTYHTLDKNISHAFSLSDLNELKDTADSIANDHESRSNNEVEFRLKSKTDSFPVANEDIQTNQRTLVNPCLYPYPISQPLSGLGAPFDGNQFLKIMPTNTKMPHYPSIMNPSMYSYINPMFMQMPYFPNYGFPAQYFHQERQMYNIPIQVSGPGGQYYLCNPIPPPVNNIATVPEIEVRREAFNLQDVMEAIPKIHTESKNLTREPIINCPNKQRSCSDGSRCVSIQHLCDNEVQCNDGSDEVMCSCKDRVGKMRICDGYFDCPNSEDEQGCFGCAENEFSCDDWSKSRKSTCIPMEHRCDNVKQCEITGKDEEDCVVLTDYVGDQPQFKISNAVGFLHRNYKGKWYPVCLGTDILAEAVCKMESGPSMVNPRLHMMMIANRYDEDFINILPNDDITLIKNCIQNRATFVECPPLYCGLRIVIKNPYRPQEINTNFEDMINELQRFSEQSLIDKSLNNSDFEEVNSVQTNRVVGGNPSQPAAWPWLVAIYKNGIFHCGGVLVNDAWVVTAAHCVDRFWQYYYDVQAGMLRRFSYSPMEQRRWAARIIPHENYRRSYLRNDIALIKLSSPVRYNRYVRPICLPTELTAGRDFLQGPPPGAVCTTIGWGATIEHGSDPDHMREVEIPVLDNCKNQEDQLGDEICAGLSQGGKDACQGDSGGPFMCRNPNNPSQWYLAGIVSHGEGCARPNEPGVYTKVSKFVGWIAENLKKEKFQHKKPLQKCPGYVCKGIQKCLPRKRRCDKIVDCLLGDDELNCDAIFNDIFKHSSQTYIVGSPISIQNENYSYMSTILDSIIPDIVFRNNKESVGIIAKNNYTMTDFSLVRNSSRIATSIKENIFFPSFINHTTQQANSEATSQLNTSSEETHNFKCKRMLQIIPMRKRCNKLLDCEDGTDEINCTCTDYVRNHNPEIICDGVTDCYDMSDEINCSKCKSSQYYCRVSRDCIDISKHCDGITDCSKREDERDCVALTDGVKLTLDSDLRSKLRMSGIITINRFGVWRPLCANMSDNEASIATNVCNLLGFEEYMEYHKYQVKDQPINATTEGFKHPNYTKKPIDICSGLYVKCSNVSLDSYVHTFNEDNMIKGAELYTLPWNAMIYSDGIYKCMGTILNAHWILTSLNCLKDPARSKLSYVAVLLGKGKSQLDVNGPHEQILRVTKFVEFGGSDILLLFLKDAINFSRYVWPSHINARRDSPHEEKCVAVGIEKHISKYIFLLPVRNCPVGFRCFKSKLTKSFSPWSGTIVCNSGNSWYPTAVYYEETGYCGFTSEKQYTSILFLKNQILKAMNMEQIPDQLNTPSCDYEGFRCKLGQCIPKNKICDGIPDCKNNEDEHTSSCIEKERDCHRTDKCECPLSYLKCRNNKCVPKTSFCNRINDCGDYSDEPDSCSCREYLSLAHPTKICDNVIHCLDRTDEDPEFCDCKLDSVKCGDSPHCVSKDMICDGFKDCPYGEDEKECLMLRTDDSKRLNTGEVIRRTGGIWHSGCFKLNYTTSELNSICNNIGISSKGAKQIINSRNSSDVVALRPEFDNFSTVWIHRTPGKKLLLKIRTGHEPYVRFISDNNCFKLFIACT